MKVEARLIAEHADRDRPRPVLLRLAAREDVACEVLVLRPNERPGHSPTIARESETRRDRLIWAVDRVTLA